MAEYISGSEEKFVKKMNAKVKELGLKHTQFKNCTGLDEEGHYSSAYDMAMIARYLVTNYPDVLKYSSIYEDYLREDTDDKFWLVNTNKLIRFYDGADGLKTGHTDDAGYCLAATAVRNDIRIIGIVLGESDSKVRNKETMELLDYGFSNVRKRVLKKKGSVVKKIKIDKADNEIVQIALKNDLSIILDSSNEKDKYKYDIEINNIKVPIKRGEVVGRIKAYDDRNVISDAELTVLDNINKIRFIDLFIKTFKDMIVGIY